MPEKKNKKRIRKPRNPEAIGDPPPYYFHDPCNAMLDFIMGGPIYPKKPTPVRTPRTTTTAAP